MNFKEVLDKLFYKNDKKTGKRRIGKLKTIVIGFFLLFFLMIIIGSIIGSSMTNLTLDENSVTLSENQTTYTVKGSTESKTINITSEELKLNNVVVSVNNGKFEYKLNIPKNIKSANVKITAPAVENKSSSYVILTLTRDESQKEEENKETNNANNNSDDGWKTVILNNSAIITDAQDYLYHNGYGFMFTIEGDSSDTLFVVPDNLLKDKFSKYLSTGNNDGKKFKIKYHSGTAEPDLGGESYPINIVDDVKEV